MKKSYKRFMAAVLTLAMTIGIPVTASAQELGEEDKTGVGDVEGTVKQDIYQVVLPTVTDDVFDFIIDPQGLINKTNGAAYDGKKFEENSTLFFKRSDGKVTEDYTSSSDAITITNMGSVAVKVSLNISIAPESLGGIVLTGDKEFTDDKNASLYMALVDGEKETPLGTEGISMEVTVNAAPEDAYEYRYDSERELYTYQMKEDVSGIEFPSYSFQLTGAANGKGDWSKLTKEVPNINVSWSITPVE